MENVLQADLQCKECFFQSKIFEVSQRFRVLFSSYKIDVARVASHAAIKSLSRTNFAKDWELY